MLATVISRPRPQRAIIDAGLKALSTDMGNAEPVGLPGVRYRPGGDEHGILEWEHEAPAPLAVGAQVTLIPGHIDTTVNLYDTYHVQRAGKDTVGASAWNGRRLGQTQRYPSRVKQVDKEKRPWS